ncbi:MAG: hypothetical protein K6F39_08935 [Lachnospiraceae bacterium]|nr:hypothetical protein [Lachnospiraceae bacterium]
MKDKELIDIFMEKTGEMLKTADKDDFSAIINALSGIVMYPKASDFDVLPDDMAFEESSDACKVFAAHNAEDEKQIKDTYFARGYYDGFFRVLNINEKVTAKTLLLRMRHAMIHTHPVVDPESKTIRFNDITKFTDVGYWNSKHYFAKDRKNPHNNHKIERIEEFKAEFTYEELSALLQGYCTLLPTVYPVSGQLS